MAKRQRRDGFKSRRLVKALQSRFHRAERATRVVDRSVGKSDHVASLVMMRHRQRRNRKKQRQKTMKQNSFHRAAKLAQTQCGHSFSCFIKRWFKTCETATQLAPKKTMKNSNRSNASKCPSAINPKPALKIAIGKRLR